MNKIKIIKKYPKSFQKLMNQSNLYIFKLNCLDSLILEKFENNEEIPIDLIFFNDRLQYITYDDLEDMKNFDMKENLDFALLDEKIVIVKSVGSCEYFEEILTGEKIPIWFFQMTRIIHRNRFIDEKDQFNFYSNVPIDIDHIPPYYIPIYGEFVAEDSLNLKVKLFSNINFFNYIGYNENYQKLNFGESINNFVLDNYEYKELYAIIETYKKARINTENNDIIYHLTSILDRYKERLEKQKNLINENHYNEIKKQEYLKELKNNRIL